MIKNLSDLVSAARAFWKSKILLTAVKVGVFDGLSGSKLSAAEIAERIKTHAAKTEILVDALVGIGLLRKDRKRYENSRLAEKYLVRYSPDYLAFGFLHYDRCWDAWGTLEEVLKTGMPLKQWEDEILLKDAKGAQDFTLKMHYNAREVASRLVEAVRGLALKQILDLGGGSGAYAVALAKAFPESSVTVLDRPHVLAITRRIITREKLQDRIRLVSGNAFRDELDGPYDLVLVSHVLHQYDWRSCVSLLQKTNTALSADGNIVVQDFVLDSSRTQPSECALLSVLMSINGYGRIYSIEDIQQHLENANFSVSKVSKFRDLLGFLEGREVAILVAKKVRLGPIVDAKGDDNRQ